MTTVAWQFKPKGGSWGPPTHNKGVAMQLMQDKSLEMRELIVKPAKVDMSGVFSKAFEEISKMSNDDFRAKMELVRGSDLYIDINPDLCPRCNNPWEEHEMGVPMPYCP